MGNLSSRTYYPEEPVLIAPPHVSPKDYSHRSRYESRSAKNVSNNHRSREYPEPIHSDYTEPDNIGRVSDVRSEQDREAHQSAAAAHARMSNQEGKGRHRHRDSDEDHIGYNFREHKTQKKQVGHARDDRHERSQRPSEDPHYVKETALLPWTHTEERPIEQRHRERHRGRSRPEDDAHRFREVEYDEVPSERKLRAKAVPHSDSARGPRSAHHRSSKSSRKGVHISVTEVTQRKPDPTRECTICTETLPLRSFSKHLPTTSCTHSPSVCRDCLQKWLKTCFKTKLWVQLSCPECSAQLEYADVQRCAPAKVFEKYDELSTKAAMEAIEGFRWCVVGRKRVKKSSKGDEGGGCGSGQVHDNGAKMKCIGCDSVQCVEHGVKWHKGETCGQYDYRTDRSIKKAEDKASRDWIKKTAKRCPNCKWNIEKNSGCDHMSCSKCRYEFCWLCLADWDPIRRQGNAMHGESCQYYPNHD